jgi:hypothetical protein
MSLKSLHKYEYSNFPNYMYTFVFKQPHKQEFHGVRSAKPAGHKPQHIILSPNTLPKLPLYCLQHGQLLHPAETTHVIITPL